MNMGMEEAADETEELGGLRLLSLRELGKENGI